MQHSRFQALNVLWLILSKMTLAFAFILTTEYGEVGKRNKIDQIMTSGYYLVARKKE